MINFDNIPIKHRWKLHPQPSSMRKVKGVIENYDFENKTVLDCFCGTGTIPFLVSDVCEFAIGSDIELMFVDLLRSFSGKSNIAFYFGIDAFSSVRRFEHDVLFIDPPNPDCVIGGRMLSAYRDTGVNGSVLNKYYKDNLSRSNLMGKGFRTFRYIIDLLDFELNQGKEVIVNMFGKYEDLKYIFKVEQVFETYYLVVDKRIYR